MAERPTRTAVLHIGPMKTGSTSIQSWLKVNREALRQAGVAVPLGGTATNLSRLAPIFQGRRRAESESGITAEALTAELARLGPEVRTAVLSGELMAQQLRPDGVARLRAALEPFFSDWIVVLYLRRQDEIEASKLTTLIRRGSAHKAYTRPVDYREIIATWAGAFGRDAIRPRLFARDCLVDGDVVADFIAAAGLPTLESAVAVPRQNGSLRPEAQAILEKVTDRFAAGGTKLLDLKGHGRLLSALDRGFAGPGRLPSRAEAEAFVARVADANEAVRADWFPERATLFADDFSRYPDVPTPEPTAAAQLEVALTVITTLLADRNSARPNRRAERKGGGGERKGRGGARRRKEKLG